ncbi:MAG: hypothetical protein MI922_11180 [Bacteroidales bacterium]|nr:hypothetical protein [Bacteroidales bacterium]
MKNILNFCGISSVKTTIFSPVKTASASKTIAWLNGIKRGIILQNNWIDFLYRVVAIMPVLRIQPSINLL